MADDAATVERRARAVRVAGELLRERTTEAHARWLTAASKAFAADTPIGREARRLLPEATGLSGPMVDWALRTTFDTVDREALLAVAREAGRSSRARGADPISLLGLILAGNVFTASVRGIVVPLLLGVPVLAKASSRDTLFPRLMRQALREADPSLGAAMDLVVFPGGRGRDCENALFSLAETIGVYGADETIAAVRHRIGRGTTLVAHGHGVSAAFCGARALESDAIAETTERIALDIAAYDQRGCLSPQAVYVERTEARSTTDFVSRLSQALSTVSKSLPRGALPNGIGAAQTQWRGLAEVEGTLVRGAAHALAHAANGRIRWSPGYRNATVVEVEGLDRALEAMGEYAAHLKCIGADRWTLPSLRNRLSGDAPWTAYATEIGTMQTPALGAPADGRPVWEGLFRAPQTPMNKR
jgi:hypothetical protein